MLSKPLKFEYLCHIVTNKYLFKDLLFLQYLFVKIISELGDLLFCTFYIQNWTLPNQ